MFFYWNWYTGGWVIGQKIGTEKVKFLKSGRHIHIGFWQKYPLEKQTLMKQDLTSYKGIVIATKLTWEHF